MSRELHCIFCGKRKLEEIGLGIWECKDCYAQFVFSQAKPNRVEVSGERGVCPVCDGGAPSYCACSCAT